MVDPGSARTGRAGKRPDLEDLEEKTGEEEEREENPGEKKRIFWKGGKKIQPKKTHFQTG
jgi:hypothetical protein